MEKLVGLFFQMHLYVLIRRWPADINLTGLIPTLDTTAADLVSFQRDALVERKDLAQKTKEFRKLDDTAKLAEIKTLLKGRALKPQA